MAHPVSLLRPLAWIALVLLASELASCASPDAPPGDAIPVRVASVGFDTEVQSPVVLLVESESPSRLPRSVSFNRVRSRCA